MEPETPSAPGDANGSDHGTATKGARPPLRPLTVALAFALVAAALAALVLGVIGGPSARDDPEPGRQRPGLLIDHDDARRVSGISLPGEPLGRRPVLLVFDRRGPSDEHISPVIDGLPEDVAVVVVAPRADDGDGKFAVVEDRDGRIRRAVGISTPRDGGFPTGYALIDREQRVRYATLDPGYADHAFEVHIVAEALAG